MVEQESYRMREDFAQQPADEVPHVARPHPLHGVALHQLRENGVYPVAKTAQERAPLGVRIALFGLVGGRQLDAPPGQLLPDQRRPVVAVPDHHTPGMLDQLGQYRKLVDVGWSYRKAADESGPADPHVHPKAVEGLLEEDVFAEGRITAEATASVGAGKQASRQGHRVADGKSRVMGCKRKELLPETLLDLPEIGRLPSEGGPMYLTEGREPCSVVPSEKEVDVLVGVESQELTDDLHCEYLRVGELWGGAALTEPMPSFELIVYQAKDRDDEGAKIHRKRPPSLRLVWAPPSVGRSPMLFNRSEKLAHGVS